eukprot:gene3611-4493_t
MKFGVLENNTIQKYFSVNARYPSFAHDFAISQNYAVLIESSVHFDPNGLFTGELFTLNPKYNLRVGLLPKADGQADDIIWFEADQPYAIVHVCNAWEEGNGRSSTSDDHDSSNNNSSDVEVVIWAPSPQRWNTNFFDTLNSPTEFRLNLKTKKIQVTQLHIPASRFPVPFATSASSTHPPPFPSPSESRIIDVEFPRVHPSYTGRPTRYGYFYASDRALNGSGVAKVDFMLKEVLTIVWFDEGYVSGEVVPVPKPRRENETDIALEQPSDDVYLVAFLSHPNASEPSYWVVYD